MIKFNISEKLLQAVLRMHINYWIPLPPTLLVTPTISPFIDKSLKANEYEINFEIESNFN